MTGRFFLILLLLIGWILLGLFFCRKYLCGLSNSIAAAPAAAAAAPAKDVCTTKWLLKDGRFSTKEVANNFRFRKSTFTTPNLNNDLSIAVDKIVDHLKKNDKKSLTITGYYDDDETNRSILGNLGLARANTIKRIFTGKGIGSNRVNIASELVEENCFKNDSLMRGGLLAFGTMGDNADRISDIKTRLFGKPIILHFGTNQDEISLDAQQRQDFTDLLYYLDNVPSAKLDVSGHTDNEGDRNYNINLSKERADFARDYLQRNGGLNASRMDVQGFGPDKPVATNSTAEGKAQNRRVEIILK
ncbi:MAG: OmpA family protein [Bacteroidota bacterium]